MNRRLCVGIATGLVMLAIGFASQAEVDGARQLVADASAGAPVALSPESELASLIIRALILGMGLLLAAAGSASLQSRMPRGFARARAAALLIVAVAAYASYFNFFRVEHHGGMKETDVFHYYMGSKFAAEVGYFDLYDCSVAVLVDSGRLSRFDLPPVRDQRTLAMQSTGQSLARSQACRERFDPARWRDFAQDVRWFSDRFAPGRWSVVLRDHGYNPTPVWSAIGSTLTSRIPLGSTSFEMLLLLDRALVLLVIGVLVWAFGWEAGALATIVWGTGAHWGYPWIGDSLLRNLWLAALLIGLALHRKQRPALAGAALVLASALRIFPAIALVAVIVHTWMRRNDEGGMTQAMRRFLVAAFVSGLVLLGFSLLAPGRGIAGYLELAEKMSAFANHPGLNKLGLPPLLWNIVMMANGKLATNAEGGLLVLSPATSGMRALMTAAQLVLLAPCLYLFAKALRRLSSWQAPLLGLALIPLLSGPANYYYGFCIGLLLLGVARRRVYGYVLGCCSLWLASAIVFFDSPSEYFTGSVLACALCLAILLDFALARDDVEPDSAIAVAGDAAGTGGEK
jgi:hypothetical protein